MSLFSKLKRAMGFGPGEAEDDALYEDTAAACDTPAQASAQVPPAPVEPVSFSPEMQEAIFARVVEIFSGALPEFIGKAVDSQKLKAQLYEALDSDIKAYLQSVSTAAEAYCDARWKARQSDMASELDAIKLRAAEVEKQSDDIRQKQLSADRQKRALTERVHDLESQLARLESEREQYELENRSLVNRLKVANVQQEDIEKIQADLNAARLELNKFRQNPGEAAEARIKEMQEGIDSLKEQLRVSEEMREDLRSRLSEAKSDADGLRAKNSELEESLSQFDELMSRAEEFDAAMTRLSEKIQSQKKLLAKRDEEITALRATISESIRLQAEREKQLKEELSKARNVSVVSEMQVDFGAVPEDDAPRISEDDLSDIDESFESGEWFTKTPPPETPSMRAPEAEADFGYHAPRRKSPAAPNPDQLSLF